MSNTQSKPVYQETFYIIPRRIRGLPGITLAFLDVYETIFQFWNKQLPCYLSNSAIQERTGLGHTQVNKALIFFENHNELERKQHNGRRYLIQPMRIIETDCAESSPTAGAVPPPTAGAVPPPTAGAVHNINKDLLKKERENVVVAQQPTTIISKKEKFESDALSDEKNTSLFERKFKDRDVSIEQIFKKCQEYNEPKRRWVGVDLFHKWLEMENPENYTKKGSPQSMQSASSINHDELVLRSRYKNFIESAVEQRILRTRKGYQSPSYEQWKAKNA